MDILSLPNVVAHGFQTALIVSLATLLMALLRIDVPGVRYTLWRGVLALCVALPLIQGRETVAPSLPENATVEAVIVSAGAAGPTDGSGAFDGTAVMLPLLAAGICIRLGWLGISFGRLRRLRRRGQRAEPCRAHDDLQELIGARCEMRFVDRLRQPVTFGLRQPVILLPAALATADTDVQRAVISHELFHVQRRDWAWLVAEELVCAVFWFNPAIWWAVSRVQSARELVVDELAVLATGRRRAYVAALMAFADETSLAPVAAFGGRRQLFHRVVMLSKERVMSSRRLVLTSGVVAIVLTAGTWQAVNAFPLSTMPQSIRQVSPGPIEQRAKPVTPENPIPRRVHQEDASYPAEAELIGARGSVTLRVTLDEIGRVVEARRVGVRVSTTSPQATIAFSTPAAGEQKFVLNNDLDFSNKLRAAAGAFEMAAIRSVEQWRYDPPVDGPISFVVSFTFSPAGVSAAQGTAMAGGRGGGTASSLQAEGALRVGGMIKAPVKIRHVAPVYPPEARAAGVSGLVILEARIGPDGSVEEAHVLRSVPMLDQAAIDAVMQWQFRPTLLNGQPVPVMMTVTVNFQLEEAAAGTGPPRVEPVIEVTPSVTAQPVGRGRGAAPAAGTAPVVIKEVRPRYPVEAMDAKVSGSVDLEATIGVDGKVIDARVLRGIPMLDDAALEAVRQWEFAPLPQPVSVAIEMTFTLRRSR